MHSYVMFSLEKLIFKFVKQLQFIALVDMEDKLLQRHFYEGSRALERFIDTMSLSNTYIYLHDEIIYRFECTSNPTCLSIQLMERGLENLVVGAISMEPSFANFLIKEFMSIVVDTKGSHNVFLARNKNKYACDDE